MARQPLRSLRVPDHIWHAALATAADRGESLNAAANRLLANYGGVDSPEQHWFHDRRQVLDFGQALTEADVLTTADETLYYIEKPYKWDDLHDAWLELGRPRSPEPGEKADPTAWDTFLEKVEAEDDNR